MKQYHVPVYKTRLEKVGTTDTDRIEITSSKEAADFILPYLRFRATEEVVSIYLDHAGRLLGSEVVHIGSPTSSQFDVRTILKSALLAECSKLIIAHNHPIGKVTEVTEEDINATAAIAVGCQQVGIDFCDHIIVNDSGEIISLGKIVEEIMKNEEDRTIHQGSTDSRS